ncbi:MAG TPA: hypothetical protein VFY61_04380 [Pyrinomonadaceae bacterium]|nr:hypothetical protein [Pyrinomonadaceae bacterium]
MKSDVDLELLKDYLDGDVAAEEELFARYARELQVPSDLWAGIEEQIGPAHERSFKWGLRVAAVFFLVIGLGSVYLLSRGENETLAAVKLPEQTPVVIQRLPQAATRITRIKRQIVKPIVRDNPGVLSTDLGYLDIDERDTAKHIEQTENLLRSIRNFQISDTDDEIDVSYDKALSRRLLIENVVLRREAEMKAKFPTKTLLADLEPFLIDIANLPDQAKPEEVRAIKERVQKTEIVAALLDYQDRGQDRSPNNR